MKHLTRISFAAIAVAVLVTSATGVQAIAIAVSVEELVQTTELIVIGELTLVREWSREGMNYGTGQLAVETTIRGEVNPGDSLALVWENPSSRACPRVEHTRAQGRSLIWFLRRDPNGTVQAGLSSVKPIASLSTIRNALSRYPFYVKMKRGWDPGEVAVMELIFSNDVDTALSVPAIRVHNGVLEHAPGIRIAGNWWTREESDSLRFRAGRIRQSTTLASTRLEPGEQQTLSIKIADILDPVRAGGYRLSIQFRPDDAIVRHYFRVRTPFEARIAELRRTGQYLSFLASIVSGDEEGSPEYAIQQLRFMGRRAGKVAPDLYKALEVTSPELRVQIMHAINTIDSDVDRRLDFFLFHLADPDPAIYCAALFGLRCTRVSESTRGDRSEEVREAALNGIDNENSEVRRRAVQLLYGDDSGETLSLLDYLIDWDPDPDVRRTAMSVWIGLQRRAGRCSPSSSPESKRGGE